MSERTVRLASATVAAFGVVTTSYMLYVRQTEGVLVCSTGSCETVQSSAYAEVLGVPVVGLGLAGFLGLLVTALARGRWARSTQATIALCAFLFSAYLLYVQLVVIDAICQWCLATDVLTSALAALALMRLRFDAAPTSARDR
ncbi:MAG: vitamin K epoxide reductase family protein [Acidimicrobiia bacterium]